MAEVFADDILAPSQPAASPQPTRFADDLDLGIVPLKQGEQPKPDGASGGTSLENFWAGMGSWMTDKALGAQQRLLQAHIGLSKAFGGNRQHLLEAQQRLDQEIGEKRRIDRALNKTLPGTAGRIGGNVAVSMAAPARLLASVGFGAGEQLLEPTRGDESVLGNVAVGGGLAAGGYGAGRLMVEGVGRGAAAATGLRADPVRSARLNAAQRRGVPLRLGDLTQHPGTMRLENWTQSVPGSGATQMMDDQAQQIIKMLTGRLDEARPQQLKVPTEAEAVALQPQALRRLLPPDASIQQLNDQALKAMPYSTLVAAGLRAPHASTNDALAATVQQAYKANKQAAKQAFNAVDDLAKATNAPPVQFDRLRRTAKEALDENPELFKSLQDQRVAGILEDILGSTKPIPGRLLDDQGKPLTSTPAALPFDQARELRTALGSLARQGERQVLMGTTPNPKAAGQLQRLYGAVTKDIDHWGQEVADPVVGAAYKLANKTFKDGVLRFRESPTLKRVIRPDFNPDDAFGTLFKPGGRHSADDLLFALGPENRGLAEYALLEDFVGAGTKPAYDAARLATMPSAPKVSALAQEFSPAAFVNRARLYREPLSAVLNDDAVYARFLADLDLVNATRRGVTAASDPQTGARLAPLLNITATKGAALPAGHGAAKVLASPGVLRYAATKPLLEGVGELTRRAVRSPRAAALGLEETLFPDEE